MAHGGSWKLLAPPPATTKEKRVSSSALGILANVRHRQPLSGIRRCTMPLLIFLTGSCSENLFTRLFWRHNDIGGHSRLSFSTSIVSAKSMIHSATAGAIFFCNKSARAYEE